MSTEDSAQRRLQTTLSHLTESADQPELHEVSDCAAPMVSPSNNISENKCMC